MSAPPLAPRRAVAELAARLGTTDLVDVDELVVAIEASGVTDELARKRYGYPSVFALGEAALAHLAPLPRPQARPAGRYLGAALVRGALLLTPALVAVTAPGLPWPVAGAALAVGWAAAQALTPVAQAIAARSGTRYAALLLAGAFAVLGGVWALAAPEYPLGLVVLALFATVPAAMTRRAKTAVLCALVPVWAVGAALPGLLWPLAAAALPAVAVAFRPIVAASPRPPGPAPRRIARSTALHLLGGLGQATAVLLLCRMLPGDAGPPPAAAPLLVALPLIEILAGWHAARASTALDVDHAAAYRRHVRGLAYRTLIVLVPPLLAGVALIAAAGRLPAGLSAHPDAPALVLALAGGVLLAGLLAVAALLRVRGRLATGALIMVGVGAVPAVAGGSLIGWAAPPGTVPAVATAYALATVYVLALALLAYGLFDSRSYR